VGVHAHPLLLFMYRRPILCTLYGAVDFLNVLKKYRVAAIFPEQFQSFTDPLKNRTFYNYFAQIHLSYLPKGKQKKQTHSGKDESIGSYRSHVSLWISRRTYLKKDYEL
jgi:hypothetical protein